MANIHSERAPLTIQLPSEVIAELHAVARYKQVSIDEVVMEACLAYTEPYLWERAYKEWRRTHPNEPMHEFGLDGKDISQSSTAEGKE
jgi:hypothetical protein